MDRPTALDRLASPLAVTLFWIVHGLLYTAVLALLFPTIAHVDANSVDTMQDALALAYQENNPPSYEWMLYGVQQVVGEGPLSHLVLRYALMALIGITVHRMVLAYSGSRVQAAAASYGLFGFYWFAWYMHEAMTHTITLVLVCFLFFAATVRHLERPSLASAALVGLVAGLGLIAKFNFAILICAMGLTLAFDPKLRARLADPRLLVGLLVATAVAGPVIYGVSRLGGDLTAMSATQLTENRVGHLGRSLLGAGRYVTALVLFYLPWALLAGAVLLVARRRGAVERPAVRPIAEHLFARFNWTAIPAGLLAVVLFGVSSVTERYMFPVAIGVVLAFHVTWARRIPERLLLTAFVPVGLGVMVICLTIRAATGLTGAVPEGRENKRMDPYDRLAATLTERGLAEAFFITIDRFEAGNLATVLPGARAAGLISVRLRRPESYPADGRCVLFYKGRFETTETRPEPGEPPRRIAALLPEDAVVETVRVPWHPSLLGPPRTGVFHLIDLGTGADACRSVFGPADLPG